MRRRLLAAFFAFAFVAVVALEVPLGLALAGNARTSALAELQADGSSLGLLVGSALERGEPADAQALIAGFAHEEHAIVLVMSGGRTTLSAGAGAAEEMDDPTTKAIVAGAESGSTSGEEGSDDPDDDLLYAALPIEWKAASGAGTVAAVLLVAQQAAPLHSHIDGDLARLAIFGAAMLAVAAAAGTLIARSLTRPLAEIESAVASLGGGDLAERAPTGRGPAELVALGRTVNEMAERLEELLHTQRAFVADASHQLRTPMTALRLRLENLEGALGGDDATSDLGPAIAEADRLSRVVDGLLALARTDGTRPGREPVDVAEALRERVEAWGPLAEERQVRLVAAEGPGAADGRDGAATALACPGYLEQVLDNLLANALDATPEGGTVTLAGGRDGDAVEIHVVDTGPGMSAEERTRAFDRFWQKDGEPHEGAGLGLAIVAQLVRASGGSARLEAAPGGGLDAVVRLEAV